MKAYLTYALDATGNWKFIDDVPKGKGCGCICPHCKSPLCAKNDSANRKTHHFAHLKGADCKSAVETVLHMRAKEVLKEELCVRLPATKDGTQGKLLRLDRVEVEFYDCETQLRPDCIGYYGDKEIWIEFYRTHKVDARKEGKIISAHKECIEIDLNECDQDYEALRLFITEESDNRRWIWSADLPNNYDREYGHRNSLDEMSRYMLRNVVDLMAFVRNEYGQLVYVDEHKVDMNQHSYYCLVCGKELTLKQTDSGLCRFVHLDETQQCSHDIYLHKAAKAIIKHRFEMDDLYYIQVPYLCDRHKECKLFDIVQCISYEQKEFRLRQHGYDNCIENYSLPEYNGICDLVLKHASDDNNNIILTVQAGECRQDIPYDSTYRHIEVVVYGEATLVRLYKLPINSDCARYRNFGPKNIIQTSDKAERKIQRFTLYNSGKYHLCDLSCKQLRNKFSSAVADFTFTRRVENYLDAILYSLKRCYEQRLTGCYCQLCYFLKEVGYLDSCKICIRYKTQGTPHYPLDEKPINCLHFSMDRNLESQLASKLDNTYIVERFFETPQNT